MKLIIFVFVFISVSVHAQYTISPWNGSASITSCPSYNQSCSSGSYYGNTIKLGGNFSSSSPNNFNFMITKCDNSNFSTAGTYYLKSNDICNGNILAQTSVNVGSVYANVVFSLPNISSTTTFYGVYVTNNGAKYYTNGITITPPSLFPDLVISDVNFNSTTVTAGNNISFTHDLRNDGNANAGEFMVRYYLSTNSILDASDRELNYGSNYSSGLQAGYWYDNISKTVNIPSDISAGGYYIIPFIDADDQVTESNESNNKTGFQFITVTAPITLPDLQVYGLSANPSTVNKGSNLDLGYTISNPGGSAGGFSVHFFLSSNTTYDVGDTQLDMFSVNSYAGSNTSILNRILSIPSNISSGGYYILVVADFNSQVIESNENNNSEFTYINVADPPFPDLVISDVNFSSTTVTAGNNISFTHDLRNDGNANAGEFMVRYYLSTNSILDASDRELNYGSNYSSGLQAGYWYDNISKTVNIPSDISAGGYYIIPFIDADDQVTESNEGNNKTGFQFITVTAPIVPTDLIVSNLTLNTQSVEVGNSIIATYNFSNPGSSAGSFKNIFVLSNNSTYSSDDIVLHVSDIASVAGEYTANGLTQTVTIPSGTPPGNYYIVLKLDYIEQIDESNELNNSEFVFITITGSQSIAVTSPTSGSYFTGETVPINWVTTGGIGQYVSIELVNGSNNSFVAVIADPTPNDGSFSWSIPAQYTSGSYKIKVYKTGGGVSAFSEIFTIGQNPNCPTCIPSSVTVAQFAQTGQEGFCASQYLCGKGILDNNNTTSPTAKILRQDLAKVALLSVLADNQIVTIKNGGGSFPADYYPTTFTDLFQGSATSYHRYAKILSYLQGSDTSTPFDRYKADGVTPRLTFEPTGFISRADLIKVLLETWDIEENIASNVTVPYSDISSLPISTQNYIRRAFQLNIIASQTNFRPNDDATREEVFLILARMRQSLTLPAATYLTTATNYYQPANQSIGNLSIYKGLTQGNFSHHTSTDFGINDIGFSLNFAHSYQSFMTMLPDEFKLVQPLGYGWTHPYNVYMFTTVQMNDANGAIAAKPLLVLAWGDGTMDVYDNTNVNAPTPITIGTNYNVLTRVSATQYTIKTKSQHIYTFNTQGSEAGLFRLTNIKDRYNNTLSIVYKTGASVPWTPSTMVIDYVQAPSGRRINFTYDTQNRITNVNFPGSSSNTRNLTFAYTNKNLTSFKDAKGQSTGKTTTYSYGTGTEIYLLKQIAFPRGNKIENIYDPNSRLQWTQARDASNNITAKTDLTGGYGSFNADGSVTNNWTQDCSCPNSQSSAKYDKNGITTEFQNKVIKVLSPASANHPSMPSSVTYSALNGSSPQTYTPTYDSNGNVLSISRPDGKSESFTYDAYHNRRTHTDAKSITTTYNWSADGKYLNSIVRPIGNGSNLTQSFGYLTNGLMSSSTNNENIITNFGYDTRGNMNSIQIPVLGISSSAIYDFASRMTSNTNARGKTTTYIFDDNDNLTRETDPLTRQTNYGYDDNDNLLTITNAKNEVTTLGYDGFDRLISETFGGKTKTYMYDNSQNRLVEFRKAGYANNNAKRFTYTYDANNRLYGNGYITEILYDPLNRMSSIKGGTQATHQLSNFTYDALNRLTSYTDAWNNTVGYGYDDNGNETRIDYPNGNKLYKTYDNLNRLKTVSWNTNLVATYNYTGSRLDNVLYGNGVKTQYTYDNAGRPTGISTKTNNGTGSTIYAATFVLDNLGNHTEENETQPFATLPLPTAGTTSSTFTNNRINNLGSTNFTHDDDGNITAKGSSTYGYDLEDNLTSYTGSGLTMTALYDAFGNRRSVSRNGTETRYVLDINGLATVLAETNSSNTVQNYYLHGLGLVARVKADGTLHYYHGDFRGSTIALTNTSQSITHKYQYDEFGNLQNSQEADPNPFRYVGAYGIMHESPDLTYMRARYYDPTTGRFNSEDPIWSTNLYPYAGNNPVNFIDVEGKPAIAVIVIGVFIGYTLYKFVSSANKTYDQAKLFGDFRRAMQTEGYHEKYDYNSNSELKGLFSILCGSVDFAADNVMFTPPTSIPTDIYSLFEDLIIDKIVDYGIISVRKSCK